MDTHGPYVRAQKNCLYFQPLLNGTRDIVWCLWCTVEEPSVGHHLLFSSKCLQAFWTTTYCRFGLKHFFFSWGISSNIYLSILSLYEYEVVWAYFRLIFCKELAKTHMWVRVAFKTGKHLFDFPCVLKISAMEKRDDYFGKCRSPLEITWQIPRQHSSTQIMTLELWVDPSRPWPRPLAYERKATRTTLKEP